MTMKKITDEQFEAIANATTRDELANALKDIDRIELAKVGIV